MYEEDNEREATAHYQLTPIDTTWIDTDRARVGEPMQIRSRIVARELKSDDRPDLYAGTPPLEALKFIMSIAANHKEAFSIMHIDVSRAYFRAKSSETCASAIACGGQSGRRFWKMAQILENWAVEEKHVWHSRRCEQLGV